MSNEITVTNEWGYTSTLLKAAEGPLTVWIIRADLYEWAWSWPAVHIRKVFPSYGHETLDQFEIPRPPQGYMAALYAGNIRPRVPLDTKRSADERVPLVFYQAIEAYRHVARATYPLLDQSQLGPPPVGMIYRKGLSLDVAAPMLGVSGQLVRMQEQRYEGPQPPFTLQRLRNVSIDCCNSTGDVDAFCSYYGLSLGLLKILAKEHGFVADKNRYKSPQRILKDAEKGKFVDLSPERREALEAQYQRLLESQRKSYERSKSKALEARKILNEGSQQLKDFIPEILDAVRGAESFEALAQQRDFQLTHLLKAMDEIAVKFSNGTHKGWAKTLIAQIRQGHNVQAADIEVLCSLFSAPYDPNFEIIRVTQARQQAPSLIDSAIHSGNIYDELNKWEFGSLYFQIVLNEISTETKDVYLKHLIKEAASIIKYEQQFAATELELLRVITSSVIIHKKRASSINKMLDDLPSIISELENKTSFAPAALKFGYTPDISISVVTQLANKVQSERERLWLENKFYHCLNYGVKMPAGFIARFKRIIAAQSRI